MYAENVLVDNCCLSRRAAELGVCATSHKETSIVVTGHVMVAASMHCWRDTMQNAPPLDGPREIFDPSLPPAPARTVRSVRRQALDHFGHREADAVAGHIAAAGLAGSEPSTEHAGERPRLRFFDRVVLDGATAKSNARPWRAGRAGAC